MIIPKAGQRWFVKKEYLGITTESEKEWMIYEVEHESDIIYIYPIGKIKSNKAFALSTFTQIFEPSLEVKLDLILGKKDDI
jgi:hypothetical protein